MKRLILIAGLVFGLLLGTQKDAFATISIANVASVNCGATPCTTSVTSVAGDLVLAICTVGNPTSGAESTPSFSGGTAVFASMAQWNSPYWYQPAVSTIRASTTSTSMTCNTSGTAIDSYVQLFDFHSTTGIPIIDCASWSVNLADSLAQSTLAQTPTTSSDFAFGFEWGEPISSVAFALTGGGAPTCTTTGGLSLANAGYCGATLTAATATSIGTASTGNGDAYQMGLVMLIPSGGGGSNPFASPTGMVGKN